MHQVEGTIEGIVNAAFINRDFRSKYLMRESLRNLVLLAKAEQMLEIRKNGEKLTRPQGRKTAQTSNISP